MRMPDSSTGTSRSFRLAAWRMTLAREKSPPACFSTCSKVDVTPKANTGPASVRSASGMYAFMNARHEFMPGSSFQVGSVGSFR